MAKRKRENTPDTIERRIKEGRGTGRGVDYKPWVLVQDVPSQGLASRVKGVKTGRVHHMLSQLEYRCFLILDWSDRATDIREQFPLLPLEETLALAESLGIKHPRDPKTQNPTVLTSDFLITVKQGDGTGEQALSIKPSDQLARPRILEKLELERQYWTKRQVPWHIVTEHDLPLAPTKNLEWLHPYRFPDALSPLIFSEIHRVRKGLEQELLKSEPLSLTANAVDDRLGLDPGTSLSVVRHLLATRTWRVDLSEPINLAEPLVLQQPIVSASEVDVS
ncbi:MAG: heteromeric transposase endonuclease subunit TnsA [Sulfobacillus thermosulfidooxidans]|nr:MAG: heteromeric transposase endonuclease subunit TnsA [Sulfobacillus thermosulfidooxidans]